jgi:hypothetical protein
MTIPNGEISRPTTKLFGEFSLNRGRLRNLGRRYRTKMDRARTAAASGSQFNRRGYSRGIAIVIPLHPTKPFALLQLSSGSPDVRIRFEQLVAKTLVVPLRLARILFSNQAVGRTVKPIVKLKLAVPYRSVNRSSTAANDDPQPIVIRVPDRSTNRSVCRSAT